MKIGGVIYFITYVLYLGLILSDLRKAFLWRLITDKNMNFVKFEYEKCFLPRCLASYVKHTAFHVLTNVGYLILYWRGY